MSTPLKFLPPRVPLLDVRTGLISREWYLFLQGIFIRTGGESGIDSDTINVMIDNMTASLRAVNTSQVEQLLGEIALQLRAAQRPPAVSALLMRIEQLEARLAAAERRCAAAEALDRVEELKSYVLAG